MKPQTRNTAKGRIANVLSIAGSDPSGGAGVQADLKAISANGAYGMAALTALTAQNTQGVQGVHLVPPEFVADQIRVVAEDVRIDAVKIGMIATAEIARAVADALPEAPVVLDPVMVAKGGSSLLSEDAVAALRDALVPKAAVITPNLPEAAALLGRDEATTRDAMAEQAQALRTLGCAAVLLKGGHLVGEDSPDVLADADGVHWFEGARVATRNTHGTGCTLSAALAARIGRGDPLPEAVAEAKAYVARAIAGAGALDVGSGHGPTHHFAGMWA
ncbi:MULTISPECIES: bifunctional hydroxymethylpyrimidine kinase/phosphomethylpyrimidine kinase [unclassified Roseovarius]|uniref:bifunctional hydroxymethylpyrimidine kinase/phosphomethylpyrimidine kinase n=1 Tax=unclassified Roseovarius TaxID=2614913 RepID=UPI00273F735E|nr:bifunctional hydroxymethylpyrimidine kinase/phosphomethylpyrimidine kinase [Roseovarius sp. MMSF_3350]